MLLPLGQTPFRDRDTSSAFDNLVYATPSDNVLRPTLSDVIVARYPSFASGIVCGEAWCQPWGGIQEEEEEEHAG